MTNYMLFISLVDHILIIHLKGTRHSTPSTQISSHRSPIGAIQFLSNTGKPVFMNNDAIR